MSTREELREEARLERYYEQREEQYHRNKGTPDEIDGYECEHCGYIMTEAQAYKKDATCPSCDGEIK